MAHEHISRRAWENEVTEHWFMIAMLAVVGLEGLASIYLVYLVFRKSERIEGLTAAVYLEARKALTQSLTQPR